MVSGWRFVGVLVAVTAFGCATRDPKVSQPTSPPEAEVADRWTAPRLPDLPETVATMPTWASTAPPFPWLPGEDTERTRSVGTTSDGWLINAVHVPTDHAYVARIESHIPRKLDYTTQEMRDLVTAVADHVNASHPGSVLYLGNFSADGGGDIPYSVSHNSGRDGDLAFYMKDASNALVVPDTLLSFDKNLKATASDGAQVTFDVARNWRVVEAIAKNGRGVVQYVFVSRPLRAALLAEAKRAKSDAAVVAFAAELMTQPGGALPHDDHFHIRLYCSEVDVESGCVDGGSNNSGFDGFAAAKTKATKRAEDALKSDDADVRLAGARRLGVLLSSRSSPQIAKLLDDDDRRVRAAAARVLAQLRAEESAVVARSKVEEDPYVRTEIVWALGDYGTRTAIDALTALLDSARTLRFDDQTTVDLRVFVADVLSVTENPRPVAALVAVTADDDQAVRLRANRALKMLTNHDAISAETSASLHDAWASWLKRNGNKSRDAWLLDGFRRFGVERLSLRYVWELTYAILEDDHLSYNAQRVMMRLAKREAPSLSWGKTDANFYWRRWFERRCPRLGCPKIPPVLTTLK